MEVIVGILSVQHKRVEIRDFLPPGGLQEEVVVPLAVLMAELARLLPHRSSRITPLGVIEVALYPPFAVICYAKESHLRPLHPNISVMTPLSCIIASLGLVGKFEAAVGVHILRAGRK